MAKRIKDAELRNLLADVEVQVKDLLKGEAARLSKADGEEPDGDEPEASGGGEASSPAASPPPPAAEGSAETPEATSAAPGEAPGEASGAPDAGAQDPAGDGAGDPEALKSEYMKLGQEDPEALKAHYLACVEALQSIMGGGQGGPDASAPPAGPDAGPPAPAGAPGGAPAAGPPAMKAELGAVAPKGKIGNGKDRIAAVAPSTKKGEFKPGPPNGEDPTKKHEKDPRDVKIEELEKSQSIIVEALDKFLGHPLRKAVTGLGTVTTDGNPAPAITMAEAKAKLAEKVQSGKLKKSDKERVVAFSLGNIGLNDIKDLLA